MARLIVRDIDEALMRELKNRADRNGRSAEEELREILRDTLTPTPKSSAAGFKELLSQMPDSGDDRDFERIVDYGRDIEL